MGKHKEHARYNVVSVRVSNEELEMLERLSRESNKKLADLIREAFLAMGANGIESRPGGRLGAN